MNQRDAEKQFKDRLECQGWYTYTHLETGRRVTNAWASELAMIQVICGLPCEILAESEESQVCRIAPIFDKGP